MANEARLQELEQAQPETSRFRPTRLRSILVVQTHKSLFPERDVFVTLNQSHRDGIFIG